MPCFFAEDDDAGGVHGRAIGVVDLDAFDCGIAALEHRSFVSQVRLRQYRDSIVLVVWMLSPTPSHGADWQS